MSNNWWVGYSDLDPDQRGIISTSLEDNLFVIGPPGSGKTNLLLLRANHYYLSKFVDIAVVTFTRSLREFIASGADRYDFPPSKIMTCKEWQKDLLWQYGVSVPDSTGDFDTDREACHNAVEALVLEHNLSDVYDAILLDEAQDYTEKEFDIFHRLARRLFCVADDRQKIYNDYDSIAQIHATLGAPKELTHHYRNGSKICRVADEIAKKFPNHAPLAETSNYDEKLNPSTVDPFVCASLESQIQLVLERLDFQRLAFPNQYIGVICPTKPTRTAIWDAILSSQHADSAFMLSGNSSDVFPGDKQVVVSTFHAAKGLEFSALHLVACDELKKFRNNRRIAFTAVTRCKTSLSIYHSGNIHGYLESAIEKLNPPTSAPTIDDIFGGTK